MRRTLACLVITAIMDVAAFANTPAYKEKYSGGSLANLKTGDSIAIGIGENLVSIAKGKEQIVSIPADKITELNYGQDVHRRIGTAAGLAIVSFGIGALVAFSKSKKHFIGIVWDDAGKRGGMAIQADKDDYRGLLLALEGITGKKAVSADTMTVKN